MKLNKKRRIAFFTVILVICTACIGITISIQMNKYYEKEIENENKGQLYEVNQELFRSKFINSFNNKVSGEITGVQKIDEDKECIYSNSIKEKIENKYEMNVNIPVININNKDLNKYNDEIKKIFEPKIDEIKKGNINTIYTVDYIANINNDILSIVIKATLKEGENSQRIIIKTYNYDLKNEKEISLQDLTKRKSLKTKDIEIKLKEEIEKQNKEAIELKELGYNIFVRNITDEMFEIENINTYFLDSEGYIYIIYAYGNNNLTTEMDIVVF